MKWKIVAALLGVMLLVSGMALAKSEKAEANSAGAEKYVWYLSGDVMPVPPYGSGDIPGSDTASKLIVNQPNGKVKAAITGAMNRLNPDTEYTVYLSKGYEPYTAFSMVGTYKWLVLGTYEHDLMIDTYNPDGTFSGTGGYPAGAETYATTEIITGQVTGNQVTFTTTYEGPYNPGYSAIVTGTIAADGSMSGDSPWEWHTTAGKVTLASGSTGWPGLFTSNVRPFTFTTNEFGEGSWHINLRADDLAESDNEMSVWINAPGRTILISEVFTVTN